MSSRFVINRFAVSTAVAVLIFCLSVLGQRLHHRSVNKMNLPGALPPLSIGASVGLAHEIVTTLNADIASAPGWANVLSQGASIEGMIRGIILSSEYERLENRASKARPKQIERLIQLAEMMQWPLPVSEIRKKSANMSALTLARIATERYLRLYEDARMKKSPELGEGLYLSLVKWGIREGLNLNLPERMNPDLEFHKNWYQNARDDFRIWESVYRIYIGVLHEQK